MFTSAAQKASEKANTLATVLTVKICTYARKKRIKIKATHAFICLQDQVEFLSFSRWLTASTE